jgi:hypothetical protein
MITGGKHVIIYAIIIYYQIFGSRLIVLVEMIDRLYIILSGLCLKSRIKIVIEMFTFFYSWKYFDTYIFLISEICKNMILYKYIHLYAKYSFVFRFFVHYESLTYFTLVVMHTSIKNTKSQH